MFTDTKEIRIEISTKCNYDCVMCPRTSFSRERVAMSTELFKHILEKTYKEVKQINSISFSGFGEFSTDSDWRIKIKEATKYYSYIHILTNLSLLDFDDFDFLLKYVYDIRISFSSIDEESFQMSHHPQTNISYENIKRKIIYLLNKRRGNQKIILNFLAMNGKEDTAAKWTDYWLNKADLIEIWRPHNWITGKKFRKLSNKRLSTCGRPFHGPIQVQVDGTINVCCFDYNGELVIGDLKTQSYKDIFNGENMKQIQLLHSSNRADEIGLCLICDQRNDFISRKKNLIFSSAFNREDRIRKTSTCFENMFE
ncbi:MAG: SPASM domain-containing protein [Candidatus Thorarchaeota archaeon]